MIQIRTVGSVVIVHGQYRGVIKKEQSATHWVVSYERYGVNYLERVPKTAVTNPKEIQ